MNFRNIPLKIQREIAKLPKDTEFQKRFAEDKQLDEYEALQTNLTDEIHCFQLINNNAIKLNEKTYKALTPAVWSFLWHIQSPFVVGEKQITKFDVDVFLYLIQNGVNSIDISNVFSDSINYCQKNGISLEDAGEVIKLLIKLAFKPLNLFPKTLSTQKAEFDSDWITAIISIVHPLTGYTPDYIANKMSLTAVCYYFAQHKRMNGSNDIYKRPPEEILKLIDRRSAELVVERLIEYGAINETEKFKYVDLISPLK